MTAVRSHQQRLLNPDEISRLQEIAGAGHVLTHADDLDPYSHDWTEDFRYPPAAAVRPGSASEVAQILAFCNEREIPVTPQGGRTGLSGGALPLASGIALSLDRMNTILEIDEENGVATVEPGVITQTLHETVEALGLYFPPDPGSRGSCTIGGNIAENAGGPHAAKYGVTSRWVLGLEAVLADGQVIVTGGKNRKDVAGYDITSLLIGSEGTLGVVTKAWLRLIPLPRAFGTAVAPFATLEEALRCIVRFYREGLLPAACEFVDRPAMEVTSRRKGVSLPFPEAEARILFEFDGGGFEEVERDVTRAGEIALEEGALDVVLATDEPKRRALWDVRRGIGEAVRDLGESAELDLAVPRSQLVALISCVRKRAAEFGLQTVAFGHAADGNIHVHVFREGHGGRDSGYETAVRLIYEDTARLGGTVTGEHGVGITSLDVLHFCRPAPFLSVMRALKNALDPKGILNPGKLIPPLPDAERHR